MAAGTLASKGLRWSVAALFVGAAGVFVVRGAIIDRNGEESAAARRVWASQPDVLSSKIMAEVGQAAARRGDPATGRSRVAEQRLCDRADRSGALLCRSLLLRDLSGAGSPAALGGRGHGARAGTRGALTSG